MYAVVPSYCISRVLSPPTPSCKLTQSHFAVPSSIAQSTNTSFTLTWIALLCFLDMATKTVGGNAAFHNFHNDYAHIADPNERRRLALAEIDKAPFGWYHVRAVVVAGIGFFTDAYDIFAINLVTSMLGVVYWHGAKVGPGQIPSSADTAIKVATSGGTVIGQVAFGAAADILGRKKMYGIELIIIIVATLAQSLTSSSPAISIVGILVFWRVIMGIGIGGDYPLSSIITSE